MLFSGILAGMWPCGIVVLLTELFRAESKTQVYAALHELLHSYSSIATTLSKNTFCMPEFEARTHNFSRISLKHQNITSQDVSCVSCKLWLLMGFLITEFVCYDDGCHLRRFARNPSRADLTPISKKLATVEIVVDKMHMAGHTDSWCHQHCDPKLFRELDNVRMV